MKFQLSKIQVTTSPTIPRHMHDPPAKNTKAPSCKKFWIGMNVTVRMFSQFFVTSKMSKLFLSPAVFKLLWFSPIHVLLFLWNDCFVLVVLSKINEWGLWIYQFPISSLPYLSSNILLRSFYWKPNMYNVD